MSERIGSLRESMDTRGIDVALLSVGSDPLISRDTPPCRSSG